jgi:hypothetical protein
LIWHLCLGSISDPGSPSSRDRVHRPCASARAYPILHTSAPKPPTHPQVTATDTRTQLRPALPVLVPRGPRARRSFVLVATVAFAPAAGAGRHLRAGKGKRPRAPDAGRAGGRPCQPTKNGKTLGGAPRFRASCPPPLSLSCWGGRSGLAVSTNGSRNALITADSSETPRPCYRTK